MAFVAYNNTYMINLRRTYKVPLERLYRAIESNSERTLWMEPLLHFDFRHGGIILTDTGMQIGEFTEYIPAERWRIAWTSPLNETGSKVAIEFYRTSRTTSCIRIRHWCISNRKDYEELYAGWLWFLDSLEQYFVTNKYLKHDYPELFKTQAS